MLFVFERDDIITILSWLSKETLSALIYHKYEVFTWLMNTENWFQCKEVFEVKDHDAGVNQIIWFDSAEIATCSHDMKIWFWDKKTLLKIDQI